MQLIYLTLFYIYHFLKKHKNNLLQQLKLSKYFYYNKFLFLPNFNKFPILQLILFSICFFTNIKNKLLLIIFFHRFIYKFFKRKIKFFFFVFYQNHSIFPIKLLLIKNSILSFNKLLFFLIL
jgi:hypothetical protein